MRLRLEDYDFKGVVITVGPPEPPIKIVMPIQNTLVFGLIAGLQGVS